jgi:microcystin-dependent protein
VIANGNPLDATPVEANYTELYNNDVAIATLLNTVETDLNTAESDITDLQASTNLTGMILDYVGTSAPTGWLLCSGQTIGNPTSGATGRANSDTQALFTLLWNSWDNTVLPLQDSSGVAVGSRGISAAADFIANRRLPLPDLRGRVTVGLDNMGGTAANRVTSASTGGTGASTPGETGGAETHTLTAGQMPAHTHTYGPSGSLTTVNPTAGAGVIGTANSGSTGSAGSGQAHNNMQPSLFIRKIIKL